MTLTNNSIIVFLGAPGAGKGTQAKLLADELSIPHIDTGSMLRAVTREGTPLGLKAKELMDNGQLVPTSMVCDIILDRVHQPDCENGCILDGFPRNMDQINTFEEKTAETKTTITHVVNLTVDETLLTDRLVYRRVCVNPKCKKKYNLKLNPPQNDNKCDICGSELGQRTDDTLESAKKRLETYHQQTKPLVDYFDKKGVLINIDGNGQVEDIFKEIVKKVK